jgi:stage V sporulation protein B
MYLDTAVDNMLKGLDEQLSVMRYNVIDALFSLAAVWLLLPVLGIKGYILIICGSEVFNFSLSLWRLVKVTQFRLDLFERVVRPVLCIAIAVLLGRLAVEAASLPLSQLRTITAATVSGLAYLLLLRVTCCKPGKIPA